MDHKFQYFNKNRSLKYWSGTNCACGQGFCSDIIARFSWNLNHKLKPTKASFDVAIVK